MAGPILVVSPHLDDAALSLGGHIADWRADGIEVVIASVYTKGPPLDEIPASMHKFADYAVRCTEDDAACAVLGAKVVRLGQIERAFRRPYLSGWSFFTTPADRDGFTGLPGVIRALEPLASLEPEAIYVPLGIGNHVDHVEAMLAATEWALARGWRERLRFYEDFYALSRRIRRKHFVARTLEQHRRDSPLRRARRLQTILRTIDARISGPPVETFLDPALAAAEWTAMAFRFHALEQTKLAAIACYASQMEAFGGYAGIERAVRASHRLHHGEITWMQEVS